MIPEPCLHQDCSRLGVGPCFVLVVILAEIVTAIAALECSNGSSSICSSNKLHMGSHAVGVCRWLDLLVCWLVSSFAYCLVGWLLIGGVWICWSVCLFVGLRVRVLV